jgi:CBS domain-containing protein
MQIKELMTTDVSTVNPQSRIMDAAKIMRDLNVGAVPIVEGTKPVGIITDRDITIRNVANAGDINTPVNQLMSKNLVFANPDMSDQEAARLMSKKQIRRLPVVDNNNLVGIVALGDLAVESETDMEAGEALSSISIPSQPNN